ncbi:MAG: GlsB/YeaQ/YmgE family stress response membrane protein [Pirellulales bacterium]|nr:GlsB/YeaQ/YmgE family stress response membrane protein [Pirellulales bacterium]
MHLLYFLAIGLIAGWLAGKFLVGRGYGLIGNLIVGVIGAMIGGHIARLLQVQDYGRIGDIVTATLGSILLLMLLGFATRGR